MQSIMLGSLKNVMMNSMHDKSRIGACASDGIGRHRSRGDRLCHSHFPKLV